MPKISVVIPVYNVEKYLRNCLDSIATQSLEDIEIICIDDGSTDSSFSILEEYAQKDERFIILKQQNKGAGAARNKGIEVSKGDFLYFLDSDDFAEPLLFEKTYNHIKENGADICIFKNYYYNNATNEKFTNKTWEKKFSYVKNKNIFNKYVFPKTLYLLFNVPAFTKLYRRDFIIKNSIRFQEIKTCNDVFFNFYTLSKAERITTLNEHLVSYRTSQTNNLSANRNKSIDCIKLAFSLLKEKLIEDNTFDLLQESFYKRYAWAVEYETGFLSTTEIKKSWISELLKDVPKKYWTPKLKSYFDSKLDKILKKIFSITFYEQTRSLGLILFGIKIKFNIK